MGNWQPIETAPKDGMQILVWSPVFRELPPNPRYLLARWNGVLWSMGQGLGWSHEGAIECEFVWMPLPPPPGDGQ